MIFKMIVLGHVLLASAFENKALRALQADVDTLEKTLKGGDMEKRERTIPPPTLATVYASKSLTIPVNHQCTGGPCMNCRRQTYTMAGEPPLSYTRFTTLTFRYDDTAQKCACNSGDAFAVMGTTSVDTCRHFYVSNGGNTDVNVPHNWQKAYATGEGAHPPDGPGYNSVVSMSVWHGCTDAASTLSNVEARAPAPTDADGFATVGSDGKQRAELIVQSITPTWTIQGTAITHVCG